MKKVKKMWGWLVSCGIATNEEIQRATHINGVNMDVLNNILYARTGYISREQLERVEGK